MEDDTALNVPVKTRTHELNQLHEFFPVVAEGLRDAELDEAADEVSRIYEEHVAGVNPEPREAVRSPNAPQSANTTSSREADDFAAYVSMPAEDWRMTVRYFGRLRHVEGLRSEWLRIKLVDRLEDRLEEME
jgi:hypothetical protein